MGPVRTGGSLESLRERNRLRVVDALRAERRRCRAPRSRASTGLSRSTVSRLVADLQAARPGRRARRARLAHGDQGGRPPILLSLDPLGRRGVGIDFGHRHVRVAVSDLVVARSSPSARLELDVDHDAERRRSTPPPSSSREAARRGRRRARPRDRRRHGPARARSTARRGIVGSAAILPGWVGVDRRGRAARRGSACPCTSTTTPTSARSPRRRSAPGATPATSSTSRCRRASAPGSCSAAGCTAAPRGIAGEIGHVLVDPSGPICRCGNRGCLETVVAGPARCCDLLRRGARRRPDRRGHARGSPRDGRRRLPARDRRRRPRDRPRASPTCCNILNPELVVVGGDLAAAGDVLLDGDARVDRPLRAARPPRTPRDRAPACSATAPRCSARWPWSCHEAERPHRRVSPSPRCHESLQEEEHGEPLHRSRMARGGCRRSAVRTLVRRRSLRLEQRQRAVRSVSPRASSGSEGPARSPCCCPTRSRRSAGRRTTGRC